MNRPFICYKNVSRRFFRLRDGQMDEQILRSWTIPPCIVCNAVKTGKFLIAVPKALSVYYKQGSNNSQKLLWNSMGWELHDSRALSYRSSLRPTAAAKLALCRIELCTDPTRVMVGHQKRRCIGRRGRLLAQRRPDCSSALLLSTLVRYQIMSNRLSYKNATVDTTVRSSTRHSGYSAIGRWWWWSCLIFNKYNRIAML